MDCCGNKTHKENDMKANGKFSGSNFQEKIQKGGKMEIEKKTLLWIVIGALLVVLMYMTFIGGDASQVSSATQAATSAATSAASSSGMVGGC